LSSVCPPSRPALTRAVRLAASQTCQSGAWRLCHLNIAHLAHRKSLWKNQLKPTARVRYPPLMPDGAIFDSFQRELACPLDKMLPLTPKLRAATTDAERQTLQNAVTATDQQFDALVYELYGLTEQEIKLVEGNA